MNVHKLTHQYALSWAKKIMAANMLGGKCGCGINNILILAFHHNNSKKENISVLVRHRWSTIKRELATCELLCLNCHRKKHFKTNKTKQNLLSLKGNDKCEKCRYDGPGLDFHHREERDFYLGDISARKLALPIETILAELDKCIVLCPNCHALEHRDIKRFKQFKPLIEHKIATHKEYNKPIDPTIVTKMLNQEISKAEIARTIGCAKSTITRISKNHGG
jgi:hypothetical protein